MRTSADTKQLCHNEKITASIDLLLVPMHLPLGEQAKEEQPHQRAIGISCSYKKVLDHVITHQILEAYDHEK